MRKDNRISYKPHNGLLLRVLTLVLVLAVVILPTGCKSDEEESPDVGVAATQYRASSKDLNSLEFSSYSGPFVEDGSNEEVEKVLAMLLENQSDEFLDYATVTYDVGGETAEFVVSGLPAGARVWVLEKNRMVATEDIKPQFLDCQSSFRDDALITTEDLNVKTKDNTLTAKNVCDETLNNTCVYYKNVNTDGNYLGGITYMISFDTLKPNESLKKASAHFSDESRIVRYSYQKE